MTRNVRRVLERNQLTRHLLPRRREEWAAAQFTVAREAAHRDPSLLARGIGANITGCRADIIICDDVEVPNTAGTHHKRMELRERLREASFVLVPDGTQLYIGTPHSYYSIYADEPRPELDEAVPFLASYTRMNIPLVDKALDGVWPDRFGGEAVADIQRDTGPNRFRSQMMLTPGHTRDIRLDPDRLVRYEGRLRAARGQWRADPDHRRPADGRGRLLVGSGDGPADRRRRQRGRRRVHRRQRRLLAPRHPLPARRRERSRRRGRGRPALPAGDRLPARAAPAGDRDRDQRPRPLPADPAAPRARGPGTSRSRSASR